MCAGRLSEALSSAVLRNKLGVFLLFYALMTGASSQPLLFQKYSEPIQNVLQIAAARLETLPRRCLRTPIFGCEKSGRPLFKSLYFHNTMKVIRIEIFLKV